MSEPTQPGRKRRPNTGRAALIAVAITAVVAGAAALAYVVGWGIADNTPAAVASSGPPVALQMECASIKRAFDAWASDTTTLSDLPAMKDLDPAFITKDASSDGKELLAAVTGYDDAESKQLAVAVAEYGVAVGSLHLQATVKGTYAEEDYQKALATQRPIRDAYNTFWAMCSLSGAS